MSYFHFLTTGTDDPALSLLPEHKHGGYQVDSAFVFTVADPGIGIFLSLCVLRLHFLLCYKFNTLIYW